MRWRHDRFKFGRPETDRRNESLRRLPDGPLSGYRIIEMGAIGPAPFCGMLLADFGVEVIRVDRTFEPDF
jgi:crotonobetainyl-CoA:carnitine CoA-transferase CaiB-like acyl-CoA transferase